MDVNIFVSIRMSIDIVKHRYYRGNDMEEFKC